MCGLGDSDTRGFAAELRCPGDSVFERKFQLAAGICAFAFADVCIGNNGNCFLAMARYALLEMRDLRRYIGGNY